MTSSAAGEPKPEPRKRQLFNKPSWSKPQATTATTDIFSRSNLTFVDVAERERQKRKRKQEKKDAKLKAEGGGDKREAKRPRVSDESSDDEDEQESSGTEEVQKKQVEKTQSDEAGSSSVAVVKASMDATKAKSFAKVYEDTIALAKIQLEKALSSNIIELGNDDEPTSKQDEDADLVVTEVVQKKPQQEDGFDSDEEFPELVQKARERARLKRLQAEQTASNLSPTLTPDASGPQSHARRAATSPPPPPPEPIISILITSEIPNTDPLIVNRKISQPLKAVRVAWCHRQNFSDEMASSIILAWRRKRLYDVTTCRSLGIGIDADGNVLVKGAKDVLGEADRQIHMEAMTEEMFEEQKRAKNRERSPAPVEQDTDEFEAVNVAPAKKEEQVHIILKAKGLPDHKLIVKPTTTIQRMITAFRYHHELDSTREVNLMFDGERLEPSSTVGESELSDMDFIDVYIK